MGSHHYYLIDVRKLSDLQGLINAPLDANIRAHSKQDRCGGKIGEGLILD